MDHIDQNSSNDHYSNLQRDTRATQALNCVSANIYQGKSINHIDLQDDFIRNWDTILQEGSEFKIRRSNISAACREK